MAGVGTFLAKGVELVYIVFRHAIIIAFITAASMLLIIQEDLSRFLISKTKETHVAGASMYLVIL